MTLQKTVLSIPMQLGVDTKTSQTLISNQKFSAIENAVFVKGQLGTTHKRNGYSALPAVDTNGNPVIDPRNLAVFNDELDLVAHSTLYGLSESLQKWIPRGQIPSVQVSERAIVKNAVSVANPDFFTLNGVTMYAWENSNGGVSYTVIDESTGSVLQNQAQLAATVHNPKVLGLGTKLFVIVVATGGGNMTVWSIDTTTPTVSPTSTVISTAALDFVPFDAQCIAGVLQVVGTFNISGVFTFSITYSVPGFTRLTTPLQLGNQVASGVCVCNVNGSAFVALAISSPLEFFVNFLAMPANTVSSGPFTQAIPILPTRMTCVNNGTTDAFLYYEKPPLATGQLPDVNVTDFNNSTGFVSVQTYQFGASIASAPWYNATATVPQILLVYPSNVQQTFFLTQQTTGMRAVVIGKYFAQNAGPAPTNGRLPVGQNSGTNTNQIAVLSQIRLISQNDNIISILGISEITMTFGGAVRSAQLGQNLHVASGSLLWGYDGSNLVEHGFNVFPETPTLSYLTSQLSLVVDNQDPTGASPNQVSLYIPDNGADPGGPVGQLITPGEYITFNGEFSATGTPILFWFSVDGAGSAPTFGGYTKIELPISSVMTAADVAAAIYPILSSNLFGLALSPWTVGIPVPQGLGGSLTGQRITIFQNSPIPGVAQPALNRQFSVFLDYTGDGTLTGASWSIACCPANLIQGGQYFTFTVAHPYPVSALTYYRGYAWFQVSYDGGATYEGTDPSPFDGLVWPTYPYVPVHPVQPIKIISTDSADVVATKVAAALQLAFPNGGPVYGLVVGSNGPIVGVQNNAGNKFTSTAYYPTNVSVAGGQKTGESNYVGTTVDQVIAMETVEYQSVYEWFDAQGQWHQSAPSISAVAYIMGLVTLAAPGSPASQYPPVGTVIPPNAVPVIATLPLNLTQKNSILGATSDVDIAIYRTQSDPSSNPDDVVLYRVTSPTDILFNTPLTTVPVVFDDYSDDLTIASNQPIYTTGGALPYDGPPACSIVINHQDRLWLSGLEDSSLTWWSEQFNNGAGVAFSSAQTIRVNPIVGQIVGGPLTSLASMDGNIILFEQNQIWLVSGVGTDQFGNGQPFTQPQLVSSNIGCRDVGSMVLMQDGLIFKSTQGFYLLARSLQAIYLPDEEADNDTIVSAATLLGNSKQARFLTTNGATLLLDFFNYIDGQPPGYAWGSFENHEGYDSILYDGIYYYVNKANSLVFEEDEGVYSDDGAAFSMSMTTAWIKFDGVQGFGVIWRFLLKGTFPTGTSMKVQIAYNYNPTIVDTFDVPAQTSQQYQLKVYPSRPHCESMQITIQDIPTLVADQTWSLDAIDLEVGVRKGTYKNIGNGQTAG